MKISNKETKDILLIISSFLFGGLIMYILLNIYGVDKQISTTSLSKTVNKVYASTVTIESYSGGAIEATGSGFFYKKDNKNAYILTNEHILTDDKIVITTTDNKNAEATILGKDKYLDLAVLRVDKKYAKKIVNLSKNKKTQLGDSIFTITSPLGIDYKGSVTWGIISGKDRIVQTTVEEKNTSNWLMRVIQIDAAINKGSSGGALFDEQGNVIGVVTLKLIDTDIEGMGFAIPIEYAINHFKELETGKKIAWPELGISMTNVTNSSTLLSNNIKIPTDLSQGVAIISVKKNSSADKAGLKKGDIITKIDDKNIDNISYLKYVLFQHKVGDKITIKYYRNGKKRQTSVILNSSE